MNILYKQTNDTMYKTGIAGIFTLLIVVFFSIFCLPNIAPAKTARIDYIGKLPPKSKPNTDTIKYLNILEILDWNVTKVNENGNTIQFSTCLLDTIRVKEGSKIKLSSTFDVNPKLLNNPVSLVFWTEGSLRVILNSDTILATGVYQKDKKSSLSHEYYWDDQPITFRDSVQKINIEYIPENGMKNRRFTLFLHQVNEVQKDKENRINMTKNGLSHGFYYLSFGIIFLIFFYFFRSKTENLYFALFCLFAAFSFLSDHNYKIELLNRFGMFFAIFSFEFLAHFLFIIILNKRKSISIIFVIILFAVLNFFPAFRNSPSLILFNYHTGFSFIDSEIILMYIAIYPSVACLLLGFRKKSWEAKAIAIICIAATGVSIIVPLIIGIIAYIFNLKFYSSVFGNMFYVGMFIYPLSAAYILGKRNGLNQSKLIQQIQSIKQLSEENLAKEIEKQQILENQNIDLEIKVNARTTEVVQQKQEIERKKELIEIKNREITDNLTYALRIQSAILPDIQLIYKSLVQSFIFYQPKDIVSGDFYAFAEKEGKVIIIAGDCTGHGVSGAFMSMIGISLLNQIINEKGITAPANILIQLNYAVIESLKQSEKGTNDGMDITILSLDLDSLELRYACANRPIWRIRAGELESFKPNKFPVGGLQVEKNKTFEDHTLQMQKEDTIYIFTDGYADQFGGERGKKMMTAKFKEFLLSIQKNTMREQEELLKLHFDNWKGEHEQVDDVLVIGIRL